MKFFPRITMMALLASSSFGATVAHAEPSKLTHDFVNEAAIAGKFEIESSKLALKQSKNADVKKFAKMMIADHTAASKKLQEALTRSEIDPAIAPEAMDTEHEKIMADLRNEKGPAFDREYIKVQTKAHKNAVHLFSNYAENGDDKPLKKFAKKTLPTLKNHLNHVKALH